VTVLLFDICDPFKIILLSTNLIQYFLILTYIVIACVRAPGGGMD